MSATLYNKLHKNYKQLCNIIDSCGDDVIRDMYIDIAQQMRDRLQIAEIMLMDEDMGDYYNG